jgi:hypothetical protein
MNWYSYAQNKVPGGLADKKCPGDFDSDQLAKGTKVEFEHTDDKELAQEIAMDHLEEDPVYYDKLARMESGECDCSSKGSSS